MSSMEVPTWYPPGYRFDPEDDELIQHYLMRKVTNPDFKVHFIKEVDIYKFHPGELITDGSTNEDHYFFTQRKRKHQQGSRASRQTKGGSMWKATNGEKLILDSKSKIRIGCKTTLVYYENKQGTKAIKTNWIMHEFRLNDTATKRNNGMKHYDWVICRIHERVLNKKDVGYEEKKFIKNAVEEGKNKGSSGDGEETDQDFNQVLSDFMDSVYSTDLLPLPEDLWTVSSRHYDAFSQF